MQEKKPQTTIGDMPVWCHHHCTKMRLAHLGLMNDFLVIEGSAAELIIQRLRTGWLVKWHVIQSPDGQCSGQTVFSQDDLLAAFGIIDNNVRDSEWLVSQYGGTAANQGKFIRCQDYLNIPAPGTGHDGDPNISIEINEEMRKAIMKLTYNSRA